MPFGSPLAQDQQVGNLAACFALSNERGDFAFTSRQSAKCAPGCLTRAQRLLFWEGAKRRTQELVAQGGLSNGGRQFFDKLARCRAFLSFLIFTLEQLLGLP